MRAETNNHNKVFPCPYCLHRFYNENAFTKHIKDCSQNPPCRIIFPSKNIKIRKGDEAELEHQTIDELLEIDAAERKELELIEAIIDGRCPENILAYTQQHYEEAVPFTVYADFESFIDKDDVHTVSGFCTLVTSKFDFINDKLPYCYSGPDPLKRFFEHLTEVREEVQSFLSVNNPMTPLSDDQQLLHDQATHCHICFEQFTLNNHKVRHHCHVTSDYIAPACNSCNLKLKPRKFSKAQIKEGYGIGGKEFFIPIFFHNLRGYDSHLIIKALDKYFAPDIHVIASTTEKFMSFTVGGFRFVDSYQFLTASLDSLVKVLAKDGRDAFKHTLRRFPDQTEFDLVSRKGVYMYEYMTDREKFAETSLPPKEKFFSKLTGEAISDEKYDHAMKVWSVFEMQSIREYHDLYLTTDVLLLADVFENSQKLALSNYSLDPCHFITTPGLTMCAALKYTRVHLELLTNIDQLLFFERGIRGGVSGIMNRYARANNPLLDGYNPDNPNKFILYTDMNNLYGRAMIDPLPVSGFRFLRRDEIASLNILDVADDAEIGYALEVDLDYPHRLHDAHNDYPLAPEHIEITPDMLSPYSQHLLQNLRKSW